ncbi:cytochrome aa3 quinol oxidase subunit IV [Bacillus lacus]|uniref:Quinol oxidase subunit 4 n=1 Tax=Metabacillus lacus TaxID=1983721 RepID=A0A7X2IWX4_9BACI|nr:cytochrome aa3 quinol oxidase subunit IV [Metabacillus lacus]MRX71171.1 cytochrome aa3 quinol oxidase subunit IV [Metabacillus lacus]
MVANSKSQNHFPWSHLIGFLGSIALTLLAMWLILGTDLPLVPVLIIIFGLAFVQAGIQLLMFMHMKESSSGRHQTANMLFSAFIAIVIVAGSVWILNFGMHTHH